MQILQEILDNRVFKQPLQLKNTCTISDEYSWTYQDFQHFFGVWVNLNDILLNGRHLQKESTYEHE